jgi:excisionase family DNA binding protein
MARTRKLNGLITLSEAAMRLRMNRERVLRRIQDGEIDAERVAGHWMVSAASVKEFGEASTATPMVRICGRPSVSASRQQP